jgi:hypothetical protein
MGSSESELVLLDMRSPYKWIYTRTFIPNKKFSRRCIDILFKIVDLRYNRGGKFLNYFGIPEEILVKLLAKQKNYKNMLKIMNKVAMNCGGKLRYFYYVR